MKEFVNGLEGYQTGNNYNRLKPILRKGNFSGQQDVSGQKDLVVNLPTKVVTGQGVKSPATQLQEKLGYSKGTMQARFKEWAKLSGYEGSMSSLEDIRQALLEHIDSSFRPYFGHQCPQG